ncbi:hypothetical protein F5I97DRAFT_709737 [Phlebopus sp. FC_14]|nr:hypothetical protein F5I97DRAFT_709737 [Phlebopus sp. FC_14]
MRFFKGFRLLHRRTRSEGDVSCLVPTPSTSPEKHSSSAVFTVYNGTSPEISPRSVVAPVFVPLEMSLPSFAPCVQLYSLEPATLPAASPTIEQVATLNARITDLETSLVCLREEKESLERDLEDYRADLLNTRNELYSEMLNSARHQQQSIHDFHMIQKLEARNQRMQGLLVDIGIPRNTVDEICRVLDFGTGSADDIILNAIRDASDDTTSPLAKLKPIIAGDRTPDHYQAALDLILSMRKEVRSQKKVAKFWKKLAQEDGRHATTITPSPSDISSIRENLTPERQRALNALIARRRAARCSNDEDRDVFGGQQDATSSFDDQVNAMPRLIGQEVSTSGSLSSSSTSSSTSTAHLAYLSDLPDSTSDRATETSSVNSGPSSRASTSLRRSARGSMQSAVLGSLDLNVSRSSSVGPLDPDPTEGEENHPGRDASSTVTHSRDLVQNLGRVPLGHSHRRVPSITSQGAARDDRSSFRLSTSSPVRSLVDAVAAAFPIFETPALRTPDMRLSELEPVTHTPASSETSDQDTAFDNSAFHTLLYGGNATGTPLDAHPSPADTQVNSTYDSISKSDIESNRNSRFLEHINEYSSSSLLVLEASSSTSTSASAGLAGASEESKDSLFGASNTSQTSGPTTPSKTPPISRSTPSKTGRSMLPMLRHLRRLSVTSTPTSSPDSLMHKLRGFKSPSCSPKRRCSPRSSDPVGSENISPVKGSAIPVLQRRMTVRARRISVVRHL